MCKVSVEVNKDHPNENGQNYSELHTAQGSPPSHSAEAQRQREKTAGFVVKRLQMCSD